MQYLAVAAVLISTCRNRVVWT